MKREYIDYYEETKNYLLKFTALNKRIKKLAEQIKFAEASIGSTTGGIVLGNHSRGMKHASRIENEIIHLQELREEYQELYDGYFDSRDVIFSMIREVGGEYYGALYSRFLAMKSTSDTASDLKRINGAVNKIVAEGIRRLVPIAIAYGEVEYREQQPRKIADVLDDCRLLQQAKQCAVNRLASEMDALNDESYIAEELRARWKEIHNKRISDAQLLSDVFTIRASDSKARVEKLIAILDDDAVQEVLSRYYINGENIEDIAGNVNGKKFTRKSVQELIDENAIRLNRIIKNRIAE